MVVIRGLTVIGIPAQFEASSRILIERLRSLPDME